MQVNVKPKYTAHIYRSDFVHFIILQCLGKRFFERILLLKYLLGRNRGMDARSEVKHPERFRVLST